MRKLLAVFFSLAFATVSGAQTPGTSRLWSESQALSRAAPSAATEGMVLDNVYGLRVTVCAEATRTLTGGTLNVWLYDNATALWTLNPSLAMIVTSNSVRCQTFPDRFVTVPYGRVLIQTSSVTVSAGTTVVVEVQAYLFRNAR